MIEVAKTYRFEASHQLPHHAGKCARLHGHSWRFTVRMRGQGVHEKGPMTGMLLDFDAMDEIVQPLLDEKLDHYHLNDLIPVPTSENLAAWIAGWLMGRIGSPERLGCYLAAVTVHETCTSEATFWCATTERDA